MKNKKHALVVIGGSSGAVEAMMEIISMLAIEFTIPIIVVTHQKRNTKSTLAEVLQSRTKLKVLEPDDKAKILSRHIYVAPPNYHIMVEPDSTISYSCSELVNYSRPSIDVLFETAADVYKGKTVGVLLTGSNADGANGMKAIHEKGGITIVQKPETAESPTMPKAAITKTKIDFIVELKEIVKILNNLSHGNR